MSNQPAVLIGIKEDNNGRLLKVLLLCLCLVFMGLPTCVAAAWLYRNSLLSPSRRVKLIIGVASVLAIGYGIWIYPYLLVLYDAIWQGVRQMARTQRSDETSRSFGYLVVVVTILWLATLPLSLIGAWFWKLWQDIIDLIEGPDDLKRQIAGYTQAQSSYQAAPNTPGSQRGQNPPRAQVGVIRLGEALDYRPAPRDHSIFKQDNWFCFDEFLLNEHFFVLGTTGYGKTETLKRLIFETLINTNRKVFIVDGKGDKKFGREMSLLSSKWADVPVFHLGDERAAVTYNGFEGDRLAIANRLIEMMAVGEGSPDATYYDAIVRNFMQLICYAPGGPPRDFNDVSTRLSLAWLKKVWHGNKVELDRIAALDKNKLNGMLDRMVPTARDLAPYIQQTGFTLEGVNAAIFSVDAQSYGDTAKHLIKFLIADCKNYVARKPASEKAILIIDEFGVLQNENITDLLATARSSEVGVVLATQTTASLGDEGQQEKILAVTNTQLVHRTSFPERIAEMAGTEFQPEASIQISDGAQTGMGSVRFQKAFKVHPDAVRGLGKGEAFLIRGDFASKVQIGMIATPILPPGIPDPFAAPPPPPSAPKQKNKKPPLKP